MLVNMRSLLANAQKGGYAVGSFSVANMEMVLGIIKAAEELSAPIIIQIAEVRLKQSPLDVIGPLMVAAAKGAKVPIAVHFDHGKTEEKSSALWSSASLRLCLTEAVSRLKKTLPKQKGL